ncbi:hypothetical protein HanPSC8_Chr02g0054701 [Helianthus annuus]|nr:hypothetical protein HanPSC8_Chr02g0054701 [Helianthus annuus]
MLHAPIKLRKRNLQRNLNWVKSQSAVEPVLVIGNTKASATIYSTSNFISASTAKWLSGHVLYA